MAKGNAKALTKKQLIDELEEKIQALNLLKSALISDKSRKPEMLMEYRMRFIQLLQE